MPITELRRIAGNALDGMQFNKNKLATECIALCDAYDRLSAALARAQQTSAAMANELEALKRCNPRARDSKMPPEFADIFGDGLFPRHAKTDKS